VKRIKPSFNMRPSHGVCEANDINYPLICPAIPCWPVWWIPRADGLRVSHAERDTAWCRYSETRSTSAKLWS
jgi:hypothetical protein